ncbi:MAG TPA: hypothetical protein VGB03_05040, partial [Acidimicrobiales bacterium]
ARVGGLAAVGIVAAHWLTYVVVAPSHGERHALLDATGHDALPYVVAAAVGAFAAWAARFVVAGLRGRTAPSFGATAVRLAVLQGAGWLVLEAGERALLGHGDGHWHVVAVGLAVQLLLALAGAALCRVAADVLVSLRARRHTPRATTEARPPRRVDLPPAMRLTVGATGLRGPPRASTA